MSGKEKIPGPPPPYYLSVPEEDCEVVWIVIQGKPRVKAFRWHDLPTLKWADGRLYIIGNADTRALHKAAYETAWVEKLVPEEAR